jgi:pimeloyl-[acyl-carrier protein] methyl ester esterase
MGVSETGILGLPIVLLPGLDGTSDLRDDLVSHLSRRRPVQLIRYPEREPLSYAALTALVRSQLPDGRFVILGESFSGPIAIEIATTNPRVAGLVLVSSFARHPVPGFVATMARRADPRWRPRRLINAVLFGQTGTSEQLARLHAVLARLSAAVLTLRAFEVCRVDRREQLAAVTCPVLCLHGAHDRLLPSRSLREIQHAQPGAQVHRLDAAHMLLCTHADTAGALIENFCEGACDAVQRHSKATTI